MKTPCPENPKLREYRNLKEKYIKFNSRNTSDSIATRKIDIHITEYQNSDHDIFREFASLTSKVRGPIINSFIMVEKICNGKIYDIRLSSVPVELINRKVKDFHRLGREFRNFEYLPEQISIYHKIRAGT